MRPGGMGWESALRVRVLHAKVRRSLLRAKIKGGDGRSTALRRWDVEKNGIPINQEDMAATLLAFSVNVLIGIEIVAGKPLEEKVQRDYLALWRYLGWLLGVDTPETIPVGDEPTMKSSNACETHKMPPIDPCGSRKHGSPAADQILMDGVLDFVPAPIIIDRCDDSIIHSYATLESMILHLLHPVQSSRELVSHLLNLRRSSYMIRSEVCRIFLSDPLSDELGIPRSCIRWKGWRPESLHNFIGHASLKIWVYLFLFFLRFYTLMTMEFAWFRRAATFGHGYLERKFLHLWEKSHERRVTAAASDRRGTMVPATTTSKSYCPFSMLFAPNLDPNSAM